MLRRFFIDESPRPVACPIVSFSDFIMVVNGAGVIVCNCIVIKSPLWWPQPNATTLLGCLEDESTDVVLGKTGPLTKNPQMPFGLATMKLSSPTQVVDTPKKQA